MSLTAVGKNFTRMFDQYSVICVFGSVVGCVVMPWITQVKDDDVAELVTPSWTNPVKTANLMFVFEENLIIGANKCCSTCRFNLCIPSHTPHTYTSHTHTHTHTTHTTHTHATHTTHTHATHTHTHTHTCSQSIESLIFSAIVISLTAKTLLAANRDPPIQVCRVPYPSAVGYKAELPITF